ncbi:MAG: HAD family hydrolase [bacterium]
MKGKAPRPNPAIVLDFDHTVFDTDRFFWVALRDLLPRFGVDERLWEKTYEQVWPRGYTLSRHINVIRKETALPSPQWARLQQEARRLMARARQFLYPDVMQFLKRCKAKKVPCHLITFGARPWQREKIALCGIRPFVSQVHYAPSREAKVKAAVAVARKHQPTVAIDNDPAFLDEVKQRAPDAKTYLIARISKRDEARAIESELYEYREVFRYLNVPSRRHHRRIRSLDQAPIPTFASKAPK